MSLPLLAADCLTPSADMAFGAIFYCIGVLAFGDVMLASMVLFIALGYIMWKVGIPVQVTAPLAVLLLFVMGGMNYAADQTFTNMLWMLIMGAAIVFVLAILYFTKR